MSSTLSIRLTVSALFSIFGCLIQSYYISTKYFLYETSTEIKVQKPEFIITPDMLFCLVLYDLFFDKNFPDKTVSNIMDDKPDLEQSVTFFTIVDNSKEVKTNQNSNMKSKFKPF